MARSSVISSKKIAAAAAALKKINISLLKLFLML
jgi:hypothetical protein